jgi:hypothetical protein
LDIPNVDITKMNRDKKFAGGFISWPFLYIGIFRKLCKVTPEIIFALLPVGQSTWTALFDEKIVLTALTKHFNI